MAKVLLVEDDKDMIDLLRHALGSGGHDVLDCQTGKECFSMLPENEIDLIILDIMLPAMDGFEICRRLRENEIRTPVMMLTSRSEEIDKVLALEIGADDYVTKPFGIRELQARIKAILRRSEPNLSASANDSQDIVIGDFSISRNKMKASIHEKRLELTSKEFDLLYLLASNRGKTFSRDELLETVWGYSFSGYEHTVTSHINRLRIKLEPDITKPYYILTTWGKGYRFFE